MGRVELTLGERMVPLDSLVLGPGQLGPHAVVMAGIQASGKSTLARIATLPAPGTGP